MLTDLITFYKKKKERKIIGGQKVKRKINKYSALLSNTRNF